MNENNRSYVKVLRRTWIQDIARRHTVLVDGTPVGKLAAFQSGTYAVEPGHHTVRVAIQITGNSTSAEIGVDVDGGELRVLRTESRGLKNFLVLPLALIVPKRFAKGPWIVLKLLDAD
jgi:hypothetical protein